MGSLPWLVPSSSPEPTARLPASLRPAYRPQRSAPTGSSDGFRYGRRYDAAFESALDPVDAQLPASKATNVSTDPIFGRKPSSPNPFFRIKSSEQLRPARAVHETSHHSDRAEAAATNKLLNDDIAAAGEHNFRGVMKAHSAAFHTVVQQVSAHCDERGVLVERLRTFYSRNSDLQQRQAVNIARNELGAQLLQLEEENADLRTQLEAQRSSPFGGSGEQVQKAIEGEFCKLTEDEQIVTLSALQQAREDSLEVQEESTDRMERLTCALSTPKLLNLFSTWAVVPVLLSPYCCACSHPQACSPVAERAGGSANELELVGG